MQAADCRSPAPQRCPQRPTRQDLRWMTGSRASKKISLTLTSPAIEPPHRGRHDRKSFVGCELSGSLERRIRTGGKGSSALEKRPHGYRSTQIYYKRPVNEAN